MDKTQLFLTVFKKLEKKYSLSEKRLAGEGWKHDWQTLLVTICSAQNRDEVTIPIMERFFQKFPTLESIANADINEIREAIKSINFFENKSKYLKASAKALLEKFNGKTPQTIESLTSLPGVGRKTANLVLAEIHKQDTITVDTHVHRISNVLGLVNTKTPNETEIELQKVAPKKYWSRINRYFVLWGKDVPGRDKNKLLKKLEEL